MKSLTSIILSLVSVAMCLALTIVGTFALFSDSVTVSNHLQAGTLKVTLVRTAHSYSVLDEDGYLATTTVETESKKNTEFTNAFDLPSDALIVPQSVLSASFEIQNNDTVAFDYSIKLVLTDSTGAVLDLSTVDGLYLPEQLDVTLTGLTGTHTLADDADDLVVNGTETVTAGEKATFTVTVTFKDLDSSVNNLAQGQEVYFDLLINATQVVSAN
ncbi:MAG: CalY family protein [Clostridia bacterium]|nr:CalY family protein [Clostridia bacterium]